jgi:hypothetical protein
MWACCSVRIRGTDAGECAAAGDDAPTCGRIGHEKSIRPATVETDEQKLRQAACCPERIRGSQ